MSPERGPGGPAEPRGREHEETGGDRAPGEAPRPEDFDRERRAIVRKVGLISWGLAAAAVVLAVLGGALLAWIFTGAGLPFLRTWLLVSLLLLAIPVAVHLAPRPRSRDAGKNSS